MTKKSLVNLLLEVVLSNNKEAPKVKDNRIVGHVNSHKQASLAIDGHGLDLVLRLERQELALIIDEVDSLDGVVEGRVEDVFGEGDVGGHVRGGVVGGEGWVREEHRCWQC